MFKLHGAGQTKLQGLALFIIERIAGKGQLIPRVFDIYSWALRRTNAGLTRILTGTASPTSSTIFPRHRVVVRFLSNRVRRQVHLKISAPGLVSLLKASYT